EHAGWKRSSHRTFAIPKQIEPVDEVHQCPRGHRDHERNCQRQHLMCTSRPMPEVMQELFHNGEPSVGGMHLKCETGDERAIQLNYPTPQPSLRFAGPSSPGSTLPGSSKIAVLINPGRVLPGLGFAHI